MAPHQPKIPITDVGSHFNPQSYIRNAEAAFRNNSVTEFLTVRAGPVESALSANDVQLQRPKFDLHDGNPVRKLRPGDGKEFTG
jgi:hypothetical protein